MESFLNKVEREANLEAQRIRGEAQQVVDVLKALNLEVPQELQHIVSHLPVEVPSVKEAAEQEERKQGRQNHAKRIAKIQAKAEAEYQQVRAEIYGVLRKGPKLRDEVMKEIPRTENRIQTTANRMKKDGELDFRTKGFQGTSEWFLTERPVTLEQLRDEVVDRKGGDIPLAETKVKLGFQKEEHLIKMLDELVEQGIIRRTEDDTYENYMSMPTSDLRTLHEKKNYSVVGNGVAGTGRFKVTSDSEVQKLLNKAKAKGAKVRQTGGGHIQIEHDGKTIIIGKSPSKSGLLQDKNRVDSLLGLNV